MTDTPEPLSAADMLTHLHEQGDQGSDYNDHMDGWFAWKITDAGTGEGILEVTFEPRSEADGNVPGEAQVRRWKLILDPL